MINGRTARIGVSDRCIARGVLRSPAGSGLMDSAHKCLTPGTCTWRQPMVLAFRSSTPIRNAYACRRRRFGDHGRGACFLRGRSVAARQKAFWFAFFPSAVGSGECSRRGSNRLATRSKQTGVPGLGQHRRCFGWNPASRFLPNSARRRYRSAFPVWDASVRHPSTACTEPVRRATRAPEGSAANPICAAGSQRR